MLTHDEIIEVMKANKGRTMVEFAQAIDAVAVRKVSGHGPICGENAAIDADLAGCGKPIGSQYEVYRCTDCGVPFHRACAIKHFTTDTPEHAGHLLEEQIRRIDAKQALTNAPRSVSEPSVNPTSNAPRSISEPVIAGSAVVGGVDSPRGGER